MGHSAEVASHICTYDRVVESASGPIAIPAPAQVAFPREWLDNATDVEALREAQPPETQVISENEVIIVTGQELVLEPRWFRKGGFARLRRAVRQGYVERWSSDVIVVRGDRRIRTSRRTPILFARVHERVNA